ncbi:MAG TPA: hypothetical protein VIA18_26380 [Polyangia bacterium]|nr:hypothetical protein [Polyangia bacterium]
MTLGSAFRRAVSFCILVTFHTAFAVEGPSDEHALPCRPTIACTADIVPPGDFEIEVGYLLRRFRDTTLQHSTPLLMKLTLATWAQLQVGSNGGIFASGPAPAKYLDDILVGIKLHLHDQEPRFPSLSFSATLSIPTPAQPEALRTYDLEMIAYITKDISKVHADLNLGLNVWQLSAPSIQIWAALALSVELPRHTCVMAEGYLYGDAGPIAPSDAGLLLAACWTPRSFVTLDAGIDVGLEHARIVSAFVGMTVIPVRFWHPRSH